MLGQVLELTFGCDLTIGPSLEEGFYYDCFLVRRARAQRDALMRRGVTSTSHWFPSPVPPPTGCCLRATTLLSLRPWR